MQPFNSPVECAVRILAVLVLRPEASSDVTRLVLLDHALLHSGDFEGPSSLHPAVPMRAAALTVNREDLEGGLRVLTRAGLVEVEVLSTGIQYRASDHAAHFLSLLDSAYFHELNERAGWVDQALGHLFSEDELRGALASAIDHWAEEFGSVGGRSLGGTGS